MGQRVDLHELLKIVLGSNDVYFQPPSSVRMNYPCIVYELSNRDTLFADNYPYRHDKKYKITVIERDPDSLLPDKIGSLPRCSHNQHFIADNLYHDVFSMYF